MFCMLFCCLAFRRRRQRRMKNMPENARVDGFKFASWLFYDEINDTTTRRRQQAKTCETWNRHERVKGEERRNSMLRCWWCANKLLANRSCVFWFMATHSLLSFQLRFLSINLEKVQARERECCIFMQPNCFLISLERVQSTISSFISSARAICTSSSSSFWKLFFCLEFIA